VTPVEAPEQPKPEAESSDVAAQKIEPLIVHTPIHLAPAPRASKAMDGRSVGSGIFQFREARASEQTLVNTTEEAPVPTPFTAPTFLKFPTRPVEHSHTPSPPALLSSIGHSHPWSVYCNECDKAMADAHFHCSICDNGDYDLCEDCVASGKMCPGEGHWLIKRNIKDGQVIVSKVYRIPPRAKAEPAAVKQDAPAIKQEMPGAFAEDTKTLATEVPVPTRTCNSCVVVLPEREFVTCMSCDDFDLCISCHAGNKHGHHPAHGFKPATEETFLPLAAEPMLAPGRNVPHKAICDGCEKNIYGIRHKCLTCPDWDYCNDCILKARTAHPGHRFAPIYDPIGDAPRQPWRHYGIYCDGPLCSGKGDQTYITGVRFKCAVCHDTDFCASCEAFPGNHHNRTHPLIKFKTPVRNVSITTENEDLSGNVRMMGDRKATPPTAPIEQSNAATKVQTMAEIQPTEEIKSEEKKPESVVPPQPALNSALLNAHFVQDSIPDGMVIAPGARFAQIWTIKNPGPYAWPAGCSVRYVGGDNMLNVDGGHPGSVVDIANATESNVVGREVQVNEEIAFKVTLKAPLREGKAISYWRLKAADGTPFGHRLWCDIDVKTADVPKPMATTDLAMQQQQQVMQRQMMLQQQRQAQMLAMRQQAMRNQNDLAMRQASQAQTNDSAPRLANMFAERSSQPQGSMRPVMTPSRPELNPFMPPFNLSSAFARASSSTDEDKARKEAAKQRVEHIKAKIMRTREERAKAMQQAREEQEQKAAAMKKAFEEMNIARVLDDQVAQKEAEVKSEPKEDEEEKMEGSQMVFPKLEKESPASSTYQSVTSGSSGKGKAAYVENEEGEIERSATPSVTAPAPIAPAIEAAIASSPTQPTVDDFEDDLEVLSAADGEESEEDDGFLTDEEYDILDASDQETVA
jgi:next to BRCA1 gene 1 protein